MREEFKADEASAVESVALRERKLRPSFVTDDPPRHAPAPEEVSEPETINAPISEATESTKGTPREEPKRRRTRSEAETQDYESLFIRTAPSTTRSGKAVYIRKEFHDRITRIVHNIGFNEVSLFSYIDNVLEHHFNTWQNDINGLYRKRTPEDIV